MQVKIIIGTVAFMLTMILFGFYSLLEPQRLANFTDARLGRQIEAGAELYYANCSTCHGENGLGISGGVCYDAAGELYDCRGLQLNGRGLLCGEPSSRMDARGWVGTKYGFIHHTVSAGRPNSDMAIWSQEYGGPLQANEVENVTRFVLNWETEEMCDFVPLNFPWPEGGDSVDDPELVNMVYQDFLDTTFEEVEEINPDYEEEIAIEFPLSYENADAARGMELYGTGVGYGCTSCHGQPEEAGSNSTGPWHGDLAENAANRIPGMSAEAYIYQSILYPDVYFVPDYESGGMISYLDQMSESPQDLLDIMKYLLEGAP